MQECMAMNWDDLRILLAVERAGSLSGAARALGVNQSTVSRRIGALERALKARVMERQPDGSVLTEAGRALCDLAEATETGLELAADRAARGEVRVSGTLTIACVDMMADRFLAPLLAEFTAAHPALGITLLAGQDAVDLMRGRADVALRVSRGPDERLVGRRLCDFGLAVYRARQANPWRHAGGWIGWTDERRIEADLPGTLATPEITHRVDSFLVASALARAGLGQTVLPCYWADADPGLERAHPGVVSPKGLGLWVLFHPDRRNLPRVRRFVDFISARILERRGEFAGQL